MILPEEFTAFILVKELVGMKWDTKTNPTRQYLQSLIHREVCGQPQLGIGSNGLAAAMNMLCFGDHTV